MKTNTLIKTSPQQVFLSFAEAASIEFRLLNFLHHVLFVDAYRKQSIASRAKDK
jgi:hypothetical protein